MVLGFYLVLNAGIRHGAEGFAVHDLAEKNLDEKVST